MESSRVGVVYSTALTKVKWTALTQSQDFALRSLRTLFLSSIYSHDVLSSSAAVLTFEPVLSGRVVDIPNSMTGLSLSLSRSLALSLSLSVSFVSKYIQIYT